MEHQEEQMQSVGLAEVRENIDAIDDQIVALLARRQEWVERASSLKTDDDSVRAPDRVERVITRVRSRAAEEGASADVVERVYRAMIDTFIAFELDRFNSAH